MGFSTQLIRWHAANVEQLAELGTVTTIPNHSPDDADGFARIGIESDTHFAEVLVWDTGDAEFGSGTYANQSDEHHVLEVPTDLDALLARFTRPS